MGGAQEFSSSWMEDELSALEDKVAMPLRFTTY